MEALSARNPRVQQLRKLVKQSKARVEAGLFVIEGPGLLAEAVGSNADVRDVFVAEGSSLDPDLGQALNQTGIAVWELEPHVLESVASTTSPQPVLATVGLTNALLEDSVPAGTGLVVVGEAISEPGNAGTIIRTAAAAGATAVVFTEGSVAVHNPKVVRASAGALFRIPVVSNAKFEAMAQYLHRVGLSLVGLAGEATTHYDEVDYTQGRAIVLGNEAHGLSAQALSRVDTAVTIPMASGVESINVAAAGAAVCFEAARQRRHAASTDQ